MKNSSSAKVTPHAKLSSCIFDPLCMLDSYPKNTFQFLLLQSTFRFVIQKHELFNKKKTTDTMIFGIRKACLLKMLSIIF